MSLRASPLDLANSAAIKASTTEIESSATSTRGKSARFPPLFLNNESAVSWIAGRQSAPCNNVVHSSARRLFSAFTKVGPVSVASWPAISSISLNSSSVNNFKKRITSASALFLQNCQ